MSKELNILEQAIKHPYRGEDEDHQTSKFIVIDYLDAVQLRRGYRELREHNDLLRKRVEEMELELEGAR